MPWYAWASSQIFGRMNRQALSNLNNATRGFPRCCRAMPSRSAKRLLRNLTCEYFNLRHRPFKQPRRSPTSLPHIGIGAVPNFRSYDSATDTYRSFAGDRRACVSPNAEAPSPIAITISFDQDHARWCAAKYASYRNSDNSYQPFAGPRITCEAPGDSNRQVATAR